MLLGGGMCAQGMWGAQGMGDVQGDSDPLPWEKGQELLQSTGGRD